MVGVNISGNVELHARRWLGSAHHSSVLVWQLPSIMKLQLLSSSHCQTWTGKLALKHSLNTVIPSPCVGTITEFETGIIVLLNAQRADSSNSCILHSFTDKTEIAYQKIAIGSTGTKRKFSRDRFHAVSKPRESRFILTDIIDL